ncbi:MAG TPA: VOC family protein [Chitinophagaceae bacterium]|nr:VOC family protein [Chitinophagaceae bacterium]
MHTKEQLKKISETYFQALRDKDFSSIPFSNDIAFRAPLAPGGANHPIKGKKNVFEQWWKPLEPALEGVTINIIDHYYNESLTGLITKADITIAALRVTLRAADRFIINEEGKITEQENHFDASPMKGFIHHICLRSVDFDVTKNFYQNTLGWKLVIDNPELIIFMAGSVFIAFKKAAPRDKQYSSFSPFEVGLDHIAITCETEEELREFTQKITDAGVENTGVKLDGALNKLYVAFKDPDRIAWEFYMK